MEKTEYVEVLDTTLRDGAQTRGVTFTLHDKLRVAEKLDEIGVDIIEGGWPGSNPKDEEFFKEAKKLSLTRSRLGAFGSTRRPDVKPENDPSLNAIIKADVPVAIIFGKSWILHVLEVLRTTPEENLRMVFDTVDYLRKHGLDVIFDAEHFFDGYRDSPSYAMDVLKQAKQGGARTIVLCDTNGGTLPFRVGEIVRRVRREIDVTLGIHAHNDCGVAVANSLVAVTEGVRHVQGTMIGLGERCGNADLTQIIPNLVLKMNYRALKSAEGLRKLKDVAYYIAEISGFNIPPNYPFFGINAFAHKGGVHIDAMLKNPRTYEHVDPSLLGMERTLSVSELAGRAVLVNQAAKLGLSLTKDQVSSVLDKIKRLEAAGYHFEPADATVSLLILEAVGYNVERLKVRTWWVEVLEAGRISARAVVSMDIDGEAVTEMAEGVGPVHALDAAIRAAVLKRYPKLESTQLVNYKVSVIDTGEATAAAVRVFVEFSDNGNRWATTGVSKNIVEASLKAIVDGYSYKLLVVDGGFTSRLPEDNGS
ncbi:MAG: citramalate synthase [Candidatus Caldarchaeum sp.]